MYSSSATCEICFRLPEKSIAVILGHGLSPVSSWTSLLMLPRMFSLSSIRDAIDNRSGETVSSISMTCTMAIFNLMCLASCGPVFLSSSLRENSSSLFSG